MKDTLPGQIPTEPSVTWLCPLENPPPIGVSLLILTRLGILIRGMWSWEQEPIAWSPMPKIPPFIKKRVGLRLEDWKPKEVLPYNDKV